MEQNTIFQIRKCKRQEDPVSAYLFIFAPEIVFLIIQENKITLI